MNDQNFAVAEQDYLQTRDIFRFLAVYRLVILVAVMACSAVAVVYVKSTEPTFTARALILIDPAATQVFRDRAPTPEMMLDTAKVESQIAVIRSETVAQAVITKLDLIHDPEFLPGPSSLLSRLIGFFQAVSAGAPNSRPNQDFLSSRSVIDALRVNLEVKRTGTSYAVEIAFVSKDPNKAALLANAFAQAYIDDQVHAAAEAAKVGSVWLEQRLDQIRNDLNKAALQAQMFKTGQFVSAKPARQNGTGSIINPSPRQGDDASAGTEQPFTLAELESQVTNYKKIYETYMQAFTDAVQRQSFPVANARILTPATQPFNKSAPKTTLILIFALVFGGLIGVAISLVMMSLKDGIQTIEQIHNKLGLECLAQIPFTDTSRPSRSFRQGPQRGLLHCVEDEPFSPFSSALKLVRSTVEIDKRARGSQTVGLISTLSGEGKTTICQNLAWLLSAKGNRTLILDLDIHKAALTRTLAPDARCGLIEVLNGKADFADVIRHLKDNVGPSFFPTVAESDQAIFYEIFSSDAMRNLLDRLKTQYDYILLDMPPLQPITEGVSISAMLDSVIFITAWETSPIELVRHALRSLRHSRTRILGVVLTKVDPRFLRGSKRSQAYYLAGR